MSRLLLMSFVTTLGMAFRPGAATAWSTTLALTQEPTSHAAAPEPARPNPQQYLEAARQALDAIPPNAIHHDAQKQMARLGKDFTGFVDAYAKGPSTTTNDWKVAFGDVERDLTSLLGSGESLGAIHNQPPAVVVNGDVKMGVKNLDPVIRARLEHIRASIELFYDAATTSRSMQPVP